MDGLAVIERNARVQAKIIEDLMDVGRIISGKVRLDVESIDLVHVIEGAITTVRPAAAAKEICLQAVVDNDGDSREVMRRLLEEREAQASSSANVEDALASFNRDVPNIVLSDIGMPDRDVSQITQFV